MGLSERSPVRESGFLYFMAGWIKIHRQFLKWEWFDNDGMVRLFIFLLLSANHEPGSWHGQPVERGQLITGRKKMSENTGLSQRVVRTCLERLKSTSEITIKPTNKFSLITIVNYEKYQEDERKPTSKTSSKQSNERPTIDQQSTTNNKDKKEKNVKKKEVIVTNVEAEPPEVKEIMKIFYEINPTLNWGNKTIRGSASRLIQKLGAEKALASARAAVKVFGQPYAPTITTPLALENKLSELMAFYKKNQSTQILEV